MALTIYNNLYSVNAQRYLGIANSGLQKNIERLSSGLRINHAADDASGLAISERLRGQIRGFSMAARNAQDAISYLQTAEGGMEEVTNIIQRMRELAVQAGNGVYTTNDRRELQKEVDQLKSEIDRISSATEFNTKKLLNGSSTALWSTDVDFLNAVVRGPVREGNYQIDINTTPGLNEVYKTDIMTLNKGALGADIVQGTNTTNVALVVDPNVMTRTGTAYHTVSVSADTAVTSAINSIQQYKQTGSNWGTTQTLTGSSFDGYVELEFTNTSTALGTSTARFRTIDAKTGAVSGWTNATNAAGVLTLASPNISATVTLSSATYKAQQGDKALFTVQRSVTAAELDSTSGAGTIQISAGPNNVTGPTISYTAANSLTKADNGDSVTDFNSVKVHYADLDAATGTVNIGNMTLQFRENGTAATDPKTVAGSFQLRINGGGEVATSGTRLKDISRFVNSDGRNIMDNAQELTIYGNNRSAKIFIEGNDTIAEFEAKLTKAIVEGLGMGATSSMVAPGDSHNVINNNLVNFIGGGSATPNTNEAVSGTFVIQSALLGKDSRLTFVGDQGLIDALSLAKIQEAEGSTTNVKVYDAHNGNLIGTDSFNDGMMRGVIEGLDVRIRSTAGLNIEWDSTMRKMNYSNSGEIETAFLHVVDNRTDVQIGANEGQTINISVPQLDVLGLEIEDVFLVDIESSAKSITLLDRALERVNSARATVGAQINRLEYTINNLNTARENMTAAESRIRDLDVASETASFSRNQILVNSAIAMVAQANQLPQAVLQLLK